MTVTVRPPTIAARAPDAILVGGSAGALAAIEDLVAALPDALVAPVVIVLHVQRHLPSLLPGILAARTRRPVREPEDKEPLVPGTIYVAPPDYHLLVAEGPSVALSVDEPVHFSIPSIDVAFESAAEVLGAGVVAILLSGASEDGARGVKAVLDAGGVAFVQAPAAAESATMPEAAARMSPGARVLQVAEVRAELRALASRPDGSGRGAE